MKFMKLFVQPKAKQVKAFSMWALKFVAVMPAMLQFNKSSKFYVFYSNFGLRPSKVM